MAADTQSDTRSELLRQQKGAENGADSRGAPHDRSGH